MSFLAVTRTSQTSVLVASNTAKFYWNSTDNELQITVDGDGGILGRVAVGTVVHIGEDSRAVTSVSDIFNGDAKKMGFGEAFGSEPSGSATIVFEVADAAGTAIGARWAKSGILPIGKNYSGVVKPADIEDPDGDEAPWVVYDEAPSTMDAEDNGSVSGIPLVPPDDAIQGFVVRSYVGDGEKDRVFFPWGGAGMHKNSNVLISFDDTGLYYSFIEISIDGVLSIQAGSTGLPAGSHIEIHTHVARGPVASSTTVVLEDDQVTSDKIDSGAVHTEHLDENIDLAGAMDDGSIAHRHLGSNAVHNENIMNISAPKIIGGLLDEKVIPSIDASKLTGTINDSRIPSTISRESEVPTHFADLQGEIETDDIADDAVANDKIASLDATKLTGTIDDVRIPAGIARDSEIPDVANFIALSDVKIFARTGERNVESGDITSLVASKLTGTIDEARIPASIARDSELPTTFAELTGEIQTADIASDAVTDEKIDSVDASKLTGMIADARIPAGIARDIEFPDVSGFLDQSQVDARVVAGVSDWAEAGDGSIIPDTKISHPFTADKETKLDGIEAGAQVNPDVSSFIDSGDVKIFARTGGRNVESGDITSLDATKLSGTIGEARIPSTIARDSEIPDVSNFIESGDVKVFARTGGRNVESGDITSLSASKLTGDINESRIPSSIARDSELPTTFAELNGEIQTSDIANSAVTDEKIGSVDASKLTGTIAGARIPAGIQRGNVSEYTILPGDVGGTADVTNITSGVNLAQPFADGIQFWWISKGINTTEVTVRIDGGTQRSVWEYLRTGLGTSYVTSILHGGEIVTGMPVHIIWSDADQKFYLDASVANDKAGTRRVGTATGRLVEVTNTGRIDPAVVPDSTVEIESGGALEGDGSTGTPLDVKALGIDAARISDDAVTHAKLDTAADPTDTQILSFDSTSGRMEWRGETASTGGISAVATDATLTGTGITGSLLGIADSSITEMKLDTGGTALDGYVLTSDGIGNMVWEILPIPEIRLLPAGGDPDQVLTKRTNSHYEVEWRGIPDSTVSVAAPITGDGSSGNPIGLGVIDDARIPASIARDSELPAANRLIPDGGDDGQVLKKTSAANYAVEWEDAGGLGGSLASTTEDVSNVTFTEAEATIDFTVINVALDTGIAVPADTVTLSVNYGASTNDANAAIDLPWFDIPIEEWNRLDGVDAGDAPTHDNVRMTRTWQDANVAAAGGTSARQVWLSKGNNGNVFVMSDNVGWDIRPFRVRFEIHTALSVVTGVTGTTVAANTASPITGDGTVSSPLTIADGAIVNEKIVSLDAAKLAGTIVDARIPSTIARDSEIPNVSSWAVVANTDMIPVGKLPGEATEGLNETEVDARVMAGVENWAEVGNTDNVPATKLPLIPSEKLAPSGTTGQVLTKTTSGHEWSGGAQEAESESVAYIGSDFVTVTLWRQHTTEPSDPQTRWRWDDGWSNGAPDVTLMGDLWQFDRQAAVDYWALNPASNDSDTVWVAVGSTRRELMSDGTVTYTDYDWNVYAEFNTQYSSDGGSSVQSIATANADTTHMRIRDTDGNWTPWWPLVNDLNVWQQVAGDIFTYYSGGATSTFHIFSGDFDDFEAIRLEISPFGSWTAANGENVSSLAPTQQIILWRKTSTGWSIPAAGDITNTVQGTWHIVYDANGSNASSARQLEDDPALLVNWPPGDQSIAGVALKTGLKLNFAVSPNRLTFFGHTSSWKRLRIRAYGFRRR